MKGPVKTRSDSGEASDGEAGFFSDRPPKGPRRLAYYGLLAAPVILIFPFMSWLGAHRDAWWMEGMVPDLLLFPFAMPFVAIGYGFGIFAKSGPPKGRWQHAFGYCAMGFGVPLLWGVAAHVVMVSFAEAPGTWPGWADWSARGLISALGVTLIVLLLRHWSGRKRLPAQPPVARGLFPFFLFLVLMASWPWVGC